MLLHPCPLNFPWRCRWLCRRITRNRLLLPPKLLLHRCRRLPKDRQWGGATSFLGFYTHDDVVELEQWTVDARSARTNSVIRIEETEESPNLKVFLRFTLGALWEVKLVRESREVLIEQLRAYLAGYNQLTSFNCRQWLQLFPAWTAQERRSSWRYSPTRAGSG